MDTNHVTQEAGNRIRGAKLRESFVASTANRAACEELQRQFEEVARPGEAVPDVYTFVDYINRIAGRRFQEYLAADREIRATKSLYAYRAEQRDGAATELANLLMPTKRASDELLPAKGYKLWLHGPVARTPSSLHRQAADVAFWGHEARDDFGEPVLEGLRLEVDGLVAEIERRNDKLGGALGSLDEAASHLEATRIRARKAAEACDQGYLQMKAMLEVVCRLGGQSVAVGKYGPPSLRKLQRSKKRKRKGVVAEPMLEVEVTESDSLAMTPAVPVQEREPLPETCSVDVRESDLQTGTCSVDVRESDLQTGTCSTGVCRDASAVLDGSRRERRRVLAVTGGRGGPRGWPSALTSGPWGSRRGRLSVTEGVCGPRGRRSEVTDAVRSPENRGRALREGVTGRIRRFFTRPFGG